MENNNLTNKGAIAFGVTPESGKFLQKNPKFYEVIGKMLATYFTNKNILETQLKALHLALTDVLNDHKSFANLIQKGSLVEMEAVLKDFNKNLEKGIFIPNATDQVRDEIKSLIESKGAETHTLDVEIKNPYTDPNIGLSKDNLN